MHKSLPLLVSCLTGLWLSGCATLEDSGEVPAAATETGAGSAEETPHYADLEPEVLYLLTSAEIAAQRGRFDVTLVNYVKAARESRDKGVIERAMRIAQSLNGDNAQQQLAELWLQVDPDSLQAHRVSAIQAVKRNELKLALEHMEKIMTLGGDADFDSLAALAGNLAPSQQQELLTLYQEMARRHPGTPELEYSTALLMKVTGSPEQALEQLEPLLETDPDFLPAIILKGDLLYLTGREREAVSYLMTNTRRFPDSRQMGTLYARMLISEGELQAAQDEFSRLVKLHPDTPALRLSLALVALENNNTELAYNELTFLAEQGQHPNEANYYLGRIEDQEGNTEQAIDYYRSVSQGSYFLPALARSTALLAREGRLDEALNTLRSLREERSPQAESFWLLEVNLLLDQDRQQEALEASGEALQQFPGNVEIRYARAMLQDALGQTQGAEKDLKQIIDEDPDNAVALNALGYILATRTERLPEARKYIERALQLDPDNPAILDSMGWVLFQEGQLQPALDYLARAWNAFPDPEVAAHYGEALWMQGNEDQARKIWKEALKKDSDHEILRETIERLTGTGSR